MNDPFPTVQTPPIEGRSAGADPPSSPVASIGRYRVERRLGQGGFGIVYLAHDDQLRRPVAIKVPHAWLVAQPADAEAYLTEARTVANLDHPHIVPVYDVGATDEFPCFVVSKYVDGRDLAGRIEDSRLSLHEAVELVATVAEALHHAHKQGLVHRDVKPGNILLDRSGKPFVADFGLALREQDVGQGPRYAGTPAYMSPEQARGEGHRVDGRSDIFSLGVVFYELLTGRRPFQADSERELLDRITSVEPRPPRQIDDAIPRELDRICLKALSKRASDRYSAALDLADDLRHFLASASIEEKSTLAGRTKSEADLTAPVVTPATPPASDSRRIQIVPKGLRSFDATDAGFFLELLPGPRDRDGLPDSIRFWKTRIEATEADSSFSLGLLYGPSGCGKSSLVKAGLLPRLANSVLSVYVEATGEETESRLLKGLRRQLPELPSHLGLIDALAALRKGQFLGSGQKVLLVLDQFEQWLHAKPIEENAELVQALRHCDGGRLQAVVLVRDDFWMAVTRFMQTVEVRLVEGQNLAAVDLFDLRHAGKVLTALGRAFGVLADADAVRLHPALGPLGGRLDRLTDPFRELREGVRKAIRVADVDPEMAVTRTRKVLEFVIRDVYQRRVHEPPGSRPLENLLQRIVKDGHFPDRLDAYANTIRKLGNVGTHAFDEKVTAADVHQSLAQLVPVLEWYFDVERPDALGPQPAGPQPAPLAERPGESREEQKQFVEQAVSSLAQDGKVICVRLALFAEMVKSKAWIPATLEELGGIEGVGVSFLEETFSSRTAPLLHRYHEKSARAILKALLPAAGTDIKGHMRSQQELLEAAGYASRPQDFDDLLRILDSELRLITPTDPEGKAGQGEPGGPSLRGAGTKSYQLTHDYLVPSLREWLTRKQKETRRGRAELLLADRAAVWTARPENRQLPSLWQWFQIRWLTDRRNWTPPQRTMMAKTGKVNAVRALLLAAVLALLGWGGYQTRGTVEAHALRDRLLDANTADVPAIIQHMRPYRPWLDPLLRDAYRDAVAQKDARRQLHTSLALLPVDPAQVDFLYRRLLEAKPEDVPVIRDALFKHRDGLLERLWRVVERPEAGHESQRLRAAAALAKYDPESARWSQAQRAVGNDLVAEPALYLVWWLDALRPVRARLLPQLSVIYHDAGRDVERSLATDILADYAADNPRVLADLLMDADAKQFAVIDPKLEQHGEQGLSLLRGEIGKTLPAELPSSDERREKLAKRQANAAVALLRMNQPETVWPLLRRSSRPEDPRVRSYLIHRLAPLGADALAIIRRLDAEPDITIRRALLLSLGEFGEQALPAGARQALLPKLETLYRSDADPGLHAAAEWLLRTWKQEAWLDQVNEEWAKDTECQQKRVETIQQLLKQDKEKTPPQWFVNTQGQTFVVIPGPVEFRMGSPVTEKDWDERESQHKRRIGRSFAIAAKSVTLQQYRSLTKDKYEIGEKWTYDPALPVVGINWYMAAQYGNLLSKEEGIPEDQWCYEIKGGETKLKASYLGLTGYRLPTEAEMEYATRAGAVTSRFYGETEDLLGQYAWYTKSSNDVLKPVGRKKPNDLGLFDALGNCFTWCQEAYEEYPAARGDEAVEDKEDELMIISTTSRVLRGGSFGYPASVVRSACRNIDVPTNRTDYNGFRLARTLPPDGFTALLPARRMAGRK